MSDNESKTKKSASGTKKPRATKAAPKKSTAKAGDTASPDAVSAGTAPPAAASKDAAAKKKAPAKKPAAKKGSGKAGGPEQLELMVAEQAAADAAAAAEKTAAEKPEAKKPAAKKPAAKKPAAKKPAAKKPAAKKAEAKEPVAETAPVAEKTEAAPEAAKKKSRSRRKKPAQAETATPVPEAVVETPAVEAAAETPAPAATVQTQAEADADAEAAVEAEIDARARAGAADDDRSDDVLPVYVPLVPPRTRRFRARTTYQLRRGRVVSSTRYVPVFGESIRTAKARRDGAEASLPTPVNILALGEDGPWDALSDTVPPDARTAKMRRERRDEEDRGERRGERRDDRRRDDRGNRDERGSRERPDRRDDRRGERRDDRRGERRDDRRDDRRRDERPEQRRDDQREEKVAPPVAAAAPPAVAPPAAAVAPAAVAPPAVEVREDASREDAARTAAARVRQTRARSSATIREMLHDERPDISVAIKTLNGRTPLEAVLRSLMRQKLLYPFEVVALDGGSTDGTLEFLESRGVRTIRVQAHGMSQMDLLDRAFRETVGEMVVFLSQDAEPGDERWLDGLAGELLDDEKVVVAEGRVDDDRGGSAPPRGSRTMRFTRKDEHPETETLHLDGACIRRGAWERFRAGADSPDTWLARALAGGGVKVIRPTSYVKRHERETVAPTPKAPEPVWQRPIEAARDIVSGVLGGEGPAAVLKKALGRLLGRKK